MARNDDGEFELVLGNRQLLSVFGIVVVLLGIFFTMGYIVGRSSSPIKPIEIASANSPAPEPAAAQPGTPESTAPAMPQTDPPPPGPTTPAARPLNPLAPFEEPARQAPEAAQPQSPAPPASPPPPPPPTALDQVPAGTYWQVAAVKRPEAELLVEMLTRKGFLARLAQGPNDLFRVLVGPAPDTAALSKLKSDLEAAGYKQPLVRKY